MKAIQIGHSRVMDHTAQVKRAIGLKQDALMKKKANSVAALARHFCPVGRDRQDHARSALRDSIRVLKSRYEGYIVMAGNEQAWYASFVALGTPGTVYRFGTTAKGKKRIGKPRTPIEARPFLQESVYAARRP